MAGFWTRFKADKMALAMAVFLGIVILLSLLAPLIAPYHPAHQDIANKFAPPSAEHLLGTDQLGRDMLSRILWGGQITVLWSLATMFCTIGIGILLGVVAGYFRGWVDEVIMRVCDIMLSFPNEVLILAIIGVMGTGILNILLAMVIAKWAWYVRMIRSIVIQFMDKNYICFARVSGCSARHIINKHLLPSAMGEICVLATLDAGSIILNISALSFLGLGVQPPTAEWGMMLNEAKKVLSINPWQMLPPGFAIFLVVAAFNFLGDSIQEALDPQLDKSMKKRLSIFRRKKAVA
ncbi:nickel/cobalt ABC transporter permease [Sporomusa sp. KB1]|jgi:nickel transport system permease protein|uniref:nickel/cobalt ABC transporter permease n=1 Tax=Sporomusa sp. KB1 TaxID=943346 RepID=UPI0011A8B1A4|nr:nickel/cobalt ABC transporter permease [Sporomusa sp. KB1]TWH51650.1 nickel transport system permease protein [Sporomusa sp. KB1]TWH52229.1 nickel transport system permease protein [Sporomusa sp. KB1]